MAALRLYAPAPDVQEIRYAINDEAWGMAKLAKDRGRGAPADRLVPRPGPAPLGSRLDRGAQGRSASPWSATARTADPSSSPIRRRRPGLGDLVPLLPPSDNPLGLKRGQSKPRRQVGVIMDLPVAARPAGRHRAARGLRADPGVPGPRDRAGRRMAPGGARADRRPSPRLWARALSPDPKDARLPHRARSALPGARCNRRAVETDHGIDWLTGGRTSSFNCNGLCKHHHALKTNNGFKVVNHVDGSMEWVSPSGRRTFRPPDDLRITNYGLHPSDPAYVRQRPERLSSRVGTDPPDSG